MHGVQPTVQLVVRVCVSGLQCCILIERVYFMEAASSRDGGSSSHLRIRWRPERAPAASCVTARESSIIDLRDLRVFITRQMFTYKTKASASPSH